MPARSLQVDEILQLHTEERQQPLGRDAECLDRMGAEPQRAVAINRGVRENGERQIDALVDRPLELETRPVGGDTERLQG
jgi:hypothetical protein